MILITVVTVAVGTVLCLAFHYLNEFLIRRSCPPGSRLPPMPPSNSIFGHVELLRRDFHRKKCLEWAKEYGPVIRLKVNLMNVIFVNDYEHIKKFSSTKELTRRSSAFVTYRDDCKGLGHLNGEPWLANRKFCMSVLNKLGFGKSVMEDTIMAECRHVADNIKKANGKPLDVTGYLMSCTVKNIVAFFYGDLLKNDHSTVREILRLIMQVQAEVFAGAFHQFLPRKLRGLLPLLPFTRSYRIAEAIAKMEAICRNHIEEHNAAKCRDDADSFIRGYVEKVKESAGEPDPVFTEGYLIGIINGFLTAGTFTTTSSMVWNLVNFARHPDTVQAKVQRETDDVVRSERQPTWEDRKDMPYTMACIWEIERWKTGAPMGAAKQSVEDVVVGDFFIPKGTLLFSNIWAVHNDPTFWQDPMKFKPERFLSEDGRLLSHKPEQFIPFSIGRRTCPGEMFATVEIFLLVTLLLQKFRIVPEKPIECDLESPDISFLDISRIKLCFLPRDV